MPDDLVAVIRKALAKDPNARYQTAAQMAAALRNVLGRIKSGAPIGASAPAGTMLEEGLAPSPKAGATVLEPPPSEVLHPMGTMVENAAFPATPAAGSGRWQAPPGTSTGYSTGNAAPPSVCSAF